MFHRSARTARRTGVRPVAALTALATAGLALAAVPASATTNDDGSVTVDILGITDYHGRLVGGGSTGGAAVLAGAVEQARTANPNTLFVSSGDNVGATTFVSASQNDAPTLEALNAMGLDVSALGNHEFDKGAADLARIDADSDFPYVAANITGLDAYGLTDVKASYVKTLESGVRVGFIGVTTPTLPSLVSPAGIAELDVTDMAEAANAEAATLTDGDEANGEADIVVVLAHDGVVSEDAAALEDGSQFARLVAAVQEGGNVDAVMGGHTHMAFLDEAGTNFWVTQAGQYSEHLTKLSFTYDPDTGEVTGSTAENLPLAWTGETPAYPPSEAVQRIVDAAVAEATVIGAQKIGEVSADILRSVQPGGGENRGGESTLGNLIADLQLAATVDLDTEIALMNPGGIRQDLEYGEDGTVTYEDAALVQPFANSLMTFTLTGSQLREALEQQWQPEGSSRPFLKLGTSANLTYTYDPKAPAGQRILDIQIDGVSITDEQQIKAVANSFLAEGGDNFAALGEGTGHADAGRIDLNVMVEAFRDAEGPIAPPAEQRAVGLTGDPLVAGQQATLDISSFAFAASPDLAGEAVTVSLGGTELGSATLDKTPTQASDETGTASVTIDVPAEFAGTVQDFVLTDGVTTVTVPVLVLDPRATEPSIFDAIAANNAELFVVAAGDAGETVATRNGSTFAVLDLGGETGDAIEFTTFDFGRATDEAFFGDWDGDGVATPAVRRGNAVFVKNSLTGGEADAVFHYGRTGDLAFVGDWDGDGKDTFGVRRGSTNLLKNSLAGGAADLSYTYGRSGDEAVPGDFDGDGSDSVGVRRNNRLLLTNALAGGTAQTDFTFGRASDEVLVGKFADDEADRIALRRGGVVFVNLTNTSGEADLEFPLAE